MTKRDIGNCQERYLARSTGSLMETSLEKFGTWELTLKRDQLNHFNGLNLVDQ